MKSLYFRALTFICLLFLQINTQAAELGVSVQEVNGLLQKDRENILFIDVRDPVEIMFIGFTDEVDANVPYLMVDRSQWDDTKKRFNLFQNPAFIEDVKEQLKKKGLGNDAVIITMCRSGSERGKPSADFLRKNGFQNANYLVHGFQGSALKDGPKKGFRTQNGWQNSGLPWQPKPNPEKIYRNN
jgi:rhodanese-related sulfurtransferase